ncbi:hypothetical protein FHW16_005598 [Phyllobacterium myrsinacearum]|uniref:Uncharacterized protein n=2 Tax=Phyllobacterium myrsinacearum TaxID=28101 RepID=A0A839EP42_9HYPH|nr:hypothetical protein [Phyllobacterium myrsinacearum]
MDNTFTPLSIKTDLSWVPDTLSIGEPFVTAQTYVETYLADPKKWHWSTDLLNEPQDLVLKRVLAIISQARLPDHALALGQLGAGPLENMMSKELLDHLQSWVPFSATMSYALGMVRMTFEDTKLQQRFEIMMQRSDGVPG